MSIDAGTKRRLFLGLVGGWISRLSYTIIQLIQVPVCLHFWTESVFGNWLILMSIPNFLGLSNQGFANVASNEMTMSEARGDREASLRVFQSCWWFIVLVFCAIGLFVALVLSLFPVETLLNIHAITPHDTKWIIVFLGTSILLGQEEMLLQAAYRSIGRYSYGIMVKTGMTLAAFVALIIPVCLGYGPRTAALVYGAMYIAGTVTLALMVKKDVPWIEFGWKYASFAEIKRITPAALAFMGFPAGTALNLQGTLQAVSYTMGPVAVVVFATSRTISRVAVQMVQMITQTFEPEFSKSFAQQNVGLVRTLHRRACQGALFMASSIVAVMVLGGPSILSHWTHGVVAPSRGLLAILFAVVILYSMWSTSASILTATNQHKRLASVYLGATGVTVVTTYLCARWFGLYGAAGSLLLSELVMNFYVLPSTLKVAQDTFPAFAGSMWSVPPALHPQALMRRLKRQRGPVLEG